MAQKKLLTNGKAFKRTDDRWGGTVWSMDEKGERKRKSFSGTTKAEVTKKMTDYVAAFNDVLQESDESRKTLKESMTHWLQVFKFPSVERTTYDRCECTVEHQIFPMLGEKVICDITAADLSTTFFQRTRYCLLSEPPFVIRENSGSRIPATAPITMPAIGSSL